METAVQGKPAVPKEALFILRLYGDLNVIMNNTFVDNLAEGDADQAYFSCSSGVTNVYNNAFWPGDIRGFLYSDGSSLNLYNNDYETRSFDGPGTFNEGNNVQEAPNLGTNFSAAIRVHPHR